MGLESVVLCLDNSDWSRNGDYQPSRWEAQEQASNLISENKIESNLENSLGIISMAGKRVQVLATLTNDSSIILNSIKTVQLNGSYCDFITALNISFLLLKNRQNKNQKQKIVMFVGSPIKHQEEEFLLTARKLKKNNVSVDIISFGNIEENHNLLDKFLKGVNNANNSSLTEIPQAYYIVDYLLNTPILNSNMEQFGPVDVPNVVPGGQEQTSQVGMSQFDKDMNMAIQNSYVEDKQKIDQADEKNVQSGTINDVEMINEEEELDEQAILEQAKLLSKMEHKNVEESKKKEEDKMKDDLLNNEEFLKDVLKEVGETATDEIAKDVKDELNKEDKKKKDK